MIKILDKHVADKIAAGEVIDRPVSITQARILEWVAMSSSRGTDEDGKKSSTVIHRCQTHKSMEGNLGN